MKELFTNPNKFFQEHHGEVPATPPVVFVGLAGLLYSLASLIPLSPLFESITGAEQAIALIPAALGIALGTSMFYLMWVSAVEFRLLHYQAF